MAQLPALGFIGTGNMGSRMAANLLRAGYALTIFDARQAAAEGLLRNGARWADGPAAVAQASEIVLASLPGPAEVEAVALGDRGVLANLKRGGAFIDLSTNSPTTMRRIHAQGRERGVDVLDAPVSGGVFGAETRRLAIMVGGDRAAFERCLPIFQALGDAITYCGASGAGAVTKLVNNMISLALNTILGEALTLGVKAGVDLKTLTEVISKSGGATWKMDHVYPKFLFKGDFQPGFAVDLAAKDLRLGTALAKELGLPLDFANLAEQRYIEAQRRGWGGLTSDAVVRLFEEKAGVELRLPG